MGENDIALPDGSALDLGGVFEGGERLPAAGPFECRRPHWKVRRESVLKVLQVVAAFPARSTVFMAVWRSGGMMRVHANNRDAFIDSDIPIENEGAYDPGGRVYFLDSGKLLAFVNAYSQFAFSFDGAGDMHYESPFALYRLESAAMDLADVRLAGEEVGAWRRFPLSKGEVGVFLSLYGFSPKASDSKMLVGEGHAEAFYTLYRYEVGGLHGIPGESVVLRKLDLPVVREISDGDLHWAVTAKRVYFRFGLGVVSFLRVPFDGDAFMYPKSFAAGGRVGSFNAEIPLLRQAFRLVEMLGAGEVRFERGESAGEVVLAASDRARFRIGAGEMSAPYAVDASLLGRIVATVDGGEDLLSVVVEERGMDLGLLKDVPTMYSVSRVSPSPKPAGQAARLEVGGDAPSPAPDAGGLGIW